MSKPLSKSDFNQLEKLLFEVQKKQSCFDDRIDYIIKLIYSNFDSKVDFWFLKNASDGEVGYLIPSIVNRPPAFGKDMSYIDKVFIEASGSGIIRFCINGEEVIWNGSKGVQIPLRWLFEDFEHEITIQKVIIQPLKLMLEKP